YHAYPIAAYSPNIPWSVAPSKANNHATNLISLNGAGTSAATPQVAAAAALWLEKHHDEFDAKSWNSWEKAEAVYDALLFSAERSNQTAKWPDRYLGAGILKADAALNVSRSDVLKLNDINTIRYYKTPRDFADGARSFASMFGLAAR